MSIKSKVLAAAATLTVAGGLSTAGTLPASAATPQCGQHCIQIFSAKFGTYASPGFIETVFLGIPTAGVPTIVHRASSSDPAGDFIVTQPGRGPVSTFYADGMVSAAVNTHYGSETAVQVEYAPYGKPTACARPWPPPRTRTKDSACSRAAPRAPPCSSSISPIRPGPGRPTTSRSSTARPRTSPTRSR